MVEFMKKAMDWILDKETDAAKNNHEKPTEIDKQIKSIDARRAKLKNDYEEEDAEFGHILDRLHFIKAQSLKYYNNKND